MHLLSILVLKDQSGYFPAAANTTQPPKLSLSTGKSWAQVTRAGLAIGAADVKIAHTSSSFRLPGIAKLPKQVSVQSPKG